MKLYSNFKYTFNETVLYKVGLSGVFDVGSMLLTFPLLNGEKIGGVNFYRYKQQNKQYNLFYPVNYLFGCSPIFYIGEAAKDSCIW